MRMMMWDFHTKVQAVIFVGLFVAGTMLAIGLGSDHLEWMTLAGFLGWVFGTLSVIFYIITLILAIYRNAVRQFWCSWSPLNFGLTLYAALLMFAKSDHTIVLAWSSLLGIGLSVLLHRRYLITSRYVLIILNVMLFAPTLPFFSSYWEILFFPFATVFVVVPALFFTVDVGKHGN